MKPKTFRNKIGTLDLEFEDSSAKRMVIYTYFRNSAPDLNTRLQALRFAAKLRELADKVTEWAPSLK